MRLPVQIFYDSSVKKEGLVGLGWKIPQLESSAIPTKGGAIWTAPWGEKIFFYSRKNASGDVLDLFNEKERENAYFSPYADWTANGRADSGSWTIYGRKDMRGWEFVYVDAKLRKIEAPSGQYINFTYANGKLASVEQRGRAFISLKYNEDKLLSEILINGVSNKFVFIDGKAQILPETLAGKEEYIESKFLSKVGRDGLNPLEFSYDSEFRPVYIDDERNTLKISYNFYGYPSKTVDSFGTETIYTYDVYNRQISRERNGIVAYAEYDKLGFPHKSYSKFEGETLSSIDISYDQNGSIVSYIDQDGLEKRHERDELGRITKEIFPDSTEVGYEYDVIGKLSKVIDQNGHEINFAWNKYGLDYRRTAVGQITQNVYDQYGRLSQVDSKFENGSVDRSLHYGYDDMDRLSSISYGASENEKLKYDTWGRLIERSKNGIVSKFKYDHFGRLVEKLEGETLTKYTYDNYGKRLSRITTKGGEILDEYNTYDKFGRLVKTQSNGKIVEYIYNKKNQLSKQIIDGNKVVFEYTKLGQLSGKTLLDKDGKTLSELKYFYSKSGKLSSRLANGKLQEYKYDAKNQLLAVIDMESKSAVEEYVYDASGNILKKTVNGKTTTYTYDDANQLLSSTNPEGDITSYAYDAAGRLVKEGEKTYEYGWLDKVMRVAEDGKELARFEYHNNNQLAKVVRENDIETFEWDGLALIERNGTKYINEPHTGGGNPILATTPASNANSLTSPSQSQTIFTDMLGTSLGTVKNNAYSEIEKTTFGNLFSESAQPAKSLSSANTFFTGKPYIQELGYAFLFRNYRPDMGKWQIQDPINIIYKRHEITLNYLDEHIATIGYPNGWNNLSYCNNYVTVEFDIYGLICPICGSNTPTLFNEDSFYAFGREGTIVSPTNPIVQYIEDNLPYAHYFAVVHDSWVGTLTNMGINDWIVNIPTMPIAAIYAVNKVNYNMYLNTIAIITKKLGSPNPLPCCIKE
ncbi:MAG: hypothetical protein DBY30_04610 [Verrucomicrobia bacterium]|nr:MAG: hypothetical protein DBY30_04610 [Verrucomicrobiota bacterium]